VLPHLPIPASQPKRPRRGLRYALALALVALVVALGLGALAGCANVGYYWQSLQGHMAMVNAAKPVQDWLADAQTNDTTKRRLELSQRIRAYASSELGLPDNNSYRRYADLHRKAVTWNVVAAPPYSLKLKTWCFMVAGCVTYRGYFTEADAQREADAQKAQGMEVSVYGVPAYSTLGYMNWAGGDPLLSTFINYPEGELARLIFHELSHQVLYVQDDTMFNESFATAVERIGGAQWLQQHASQAMRDEYAQYNARRVAFRALTLATRQALEKNYAIAQAEPAQAAMKKEAIDAFRRNYETLKTQWGGYAGYDPWVAKANNASFGAQAAYDELVPQFEALYARQGSWQKFYDAWRWPNYRVSSAVRHWRSSHSLMHLLAYQLVHQLQRHNQSL
jgi:predicted aminopeptidase